VKWTEMIETLLSHLTAAVLFGALGIALFVLALRLIVRISPFSIRKEIEDDQNVALAVLMGAVFLGLALIVAAAIQG
jgi:putative membrane protein